MKSEEKNTAIYTAYDDVEQLDPIRPEKNLLRAVLFSAMSDLKKGGDATRKAREFFLNPSEEYLFSFTSICSFLDLDSKLVLMVAGITPMEHRGVSRLDDSPENSVNGAERSPEVNGD